MGIPESNIVWEEGGLADRVRRLETRFAAPGTEVTGGPQGGGGGGNPLPGTPTNLRVLGRRIVEDASGHHYYLTTLTWNGSGPLFELQYGQTSGGLSVVTGQFAFQCDNVSYAPTQGDTRAGSRAAFVVADPSAQQLKVVRTEFSDDWQYIGIPLGSASFPRGTWYIQWPTLWAATNRSASNALAVFTVNLSDMTYSEVTPPTSGTVSGEMVMSGYGSRLFLSAASSTDLWIWERTGSSWTQRLRITGSSMNSVCSMRLFEYGGDLWALVGTVGTSTYKPVYRVNLNTGSHQSVGSWTTRGALVPVDATTTMLVRNRTWCLIYADGSKTGDSTLPLPSGESQTDYHWVARDSDGVWLYVAARTSSETLYRRLYRALYQGGGWSGWTQVLSMNTGEITGITSVMPELNPYGGHLVFIPISETGNRRYLVIARNYGIYSGIVWDWFTRLITRDNQVTICVPTGTLAAAVRGVNGAGHASSWCGPVTITHDGDTSAPGAPSDLTAASIPTGAVLRWSNPGARDIRNARVYISTSPIPVDASGRVTGVQPWANIDADCAVVAGLTNGTYYARVDVVDRSGNVSPASGQVTFAVGG
jgi:hypothetical protein